MNAWICEVCEEDIRTECECPECPDCRRCGDPRCPINEGEGCGPVVWADDVWDVLWERVRLPDDPLVAGPEFHRDGGD